MRRHSCLKVIILLYAMVISLYEVVISYFAKILNFCSTEPLGQFNKTWFKASLGEGQTSLLK